MPDEFLNRRAPYPYYGRRDSYPQYKGLTSGINMLGDNAVSAGWDSMVQSLQETQSIEYADEQARQEKFKNLIDVSLKDVRGKWRDEAVTKKKDFLKTATGLAAESQGKLTWEQEKQLMEKKEGLEQFAGKSKEVEDWYNNSIQQALTIKDKVAREKTLNKIKGIMTRDNLDEVHTGTLDPSWIVQPNYTTGEVMGKITDAYDANTGKPSPSKIAGQITGLLDADDDVINWQFETWKKNNPGVIDPEQQKAGYIKYATDQKVFTMNQKPIDEFQYINKTSQYNKQDPPTPIELTPSGNRIYRHLNKGKGIPMSSIEGIDGKPHKDAALEEEMYHPDTGERVYAVTYGISNESVIAYKEDKRQGFINDIKKASGNKNMTDDEAWAAGAEEKYNRWVKYDLVKFIRENPDGVTKGITYVPKSEYQSTVEQNTVTVDDLPTYTINGVEVSEEDLVKQFKKRSPDKSVDEIVKQIRATDWSKVVDKKAGENKYVNTPGAPKATRKPGFGGIIDKGKSFLGLNKGPATKERTIKTPDEQNIVGGVDITDYATDPEHEKKIKTTYDSLREGIQGEETPGSMAAEIDKRASEAGSGITGKMVVDIARKYTVDPMLLAAIIQNDSGYGTKGKAARTNNPGNVGNDDTGQLVYYPTWEAGLEAAAKWLSGERKRSELYKGARVEKGDLAKK